MYCCPWHLAWLSAEHQQYFAATVECCGFKGRGPGPRTHWGMCVLDNILIFQGVKPTIQPVGVGYGNRPKNTLNGVGGMWRFPIYMGLPGFDLTTSARRLFQVLQNSLHNSKFYCLRQVGLAGNLPRAMHTQVRHTHPKNVKTTEIWPKTCFTYLGWSFYVVEISKKASLGRPPAPPPPPRTQYPNRVKNTCILPKTCFS